MKRVSTRALDWSGFRVAATALLVLGATASQAMTWKQRLCGTALAANGGNTAPFALANNEYGWKTWNKVQDAQPNENLMFSPTSSALALSMALNGAEGDTHAQIALLLATQGTPLADLNASAKALIADLTKKDGDEKLFIANSLWGDQNQFRFDPGYAAAMGDFYRAVVKDVNFRSADAVPAINGWVSDNTNKMIPKLLESLPSNTVMVLLNAMFFEGAWQTPFSEYATRPLPFAVKGGAPVDVLTMREPIYHAPYAENAEFQLVSLRFAKDKDGAMGNYTVDVILPRDPKGATKLTQAKYEDLVAGSQVENVNIEIPKFRFENNLSLKGILQALGMKDAFDATQAQFLPMGRAGGRLYLTDAIHGTAVEMFEKGFRAAAATALPGATESIPQAAKILFHANRPFYFVLRHRLNGAVLKIGRVTEPKWDGVTFGTVPAAKAVEPPTAVATPAEPESPAMTELAALVHKLFFASETNPGFEPIGGDPISLVSSHPDWSFVGDFATFVYLNFGEDYAEGAAAGATEEQKILAYLKRIAKVGALQRFLDTVKAERTEVAGLVDAAVATLRAEEKAPKFLGESKNFRLRRLTGDDSKDVETFDKFNVSWVIGHSEEVKLGPDWGPRFNLGITTKASPKLLGAIYLSQPSEDPERDRFRWADSPYPGGPEKGWAVLEGTHFVNGKKPAQAAWAEMIRAGADTAFARLGVTKVFAKVPDSMEYTVLLEKAGFKRIGSSQELREGPGGSETVILYELAKP